MYDTVRVETLHQWCGKTWNTRIGVNKRLMMFPNSVRHTYIFALPYG